MNKYIRFLISSFRRVLYVVCFLLGNYQKESIQIYKVFVVCFLLGNYPASGFYMPTFRNTLSVPSS